jgi:phosphate transport system substrate-binding protein
MLIAVMALGAIGLAGCGATEEDATTEETTEEEAAELTGAINVEGSDTLVNMGQAWAEAFMEENPGVMISVKGGGSGTGIAALINGTVDYANASRAMKDEEKAELAANGGEAVEHEVAIDGIAVVVNPNNPVTGLSMADLGKIYRGEIKNWKDVGGPDQAIVLLSRDSSSGTFEYFKEEVVAAEDENAEYAPEAQLLASTQAIIDEVAGNDYAIGYVGLGYLTPDVKVLEIDGVLADIETAADGSYPISRFLYMYSNGEVEGVMAAYLDWILGETGQEIVVDQGFVPLP